MFRRIAPEEYIKDVFAECKRLEIPVYFLASVPAMLMIYFWSDFWQGFCETMMLLACYLISILPAQILFLLLAAWLIKPDLKKRGIGISYPNRFPMAEEMVWDSWLRNEKTLVIFYVTLRLSCIFGLFSIFCPIISQWVK